MACIGILISTLITTVNKDARIVICYATRSVITSYDANDIIYYHYLGILQANGLLNAFSVGPGTIKS